MPLERRILRKILGKGDEQLHLPDRSHGHLSPSQVSMYLRCPKQYAFRYVDGRRSPPGIALVEGSSHHAAFEANNKFKISRGVDFKLKTLFSRFADDFSSRSKEVEEWGREDKDSVIDRGRRLLTGYLAGFAPRFKPESVEGFVEAEVCGIPFVGIVDASGLGPVRKGNKLKKCVIDYKVVGNVKSQSHADSSLQLTFYGAVAKARGFYGKDPASVGFCCLVKNRKTGSPVTWVGSTVPDSRIRHFQNTVVSVADAISRGAFPSCDPEGWVCDPRYCGFYNECRGKASKSKVQINVS